MARFTDIYKVVINHKRGINISKHFDCFDNLISDHNELNGV